MKVGIFIYPDVEPIDLATFGVLSMARRVDPDIQICTLAPQSGEVRLANGLRVIADYGVDDAPPLDVIVVTGGPGWQAQTIEKSTLDFLRTRAADTLLVSVCTGGMIMAAAGVLDGKSATTKVEVIGAEVSPLSVMASTYPEISTVHSSLVDEGTVVTGGGVTLCIDAMMHLLKTRIDPKVADETARIMEYSRAWQANMTALPPVQA
jgi:transcriptional regulator GlxA family with amidase domain